MFVLPLRISDVLCEQNCANATHTQDQVQKGKKQKETSPGRLELPTSRLTVGRANQLRHGDLLLRNPAKMSFLY